MTERTYYIATGDTEAQLRALLARHQAAQEVWWEFARKHGAARIQPSGRSLYALQWDGERAVGWGVKGRPNTKTKAGKEAAKEMAALPEGASGWDITDIIGLPGFLVVDSAFKSAAAVLVGPKTFVWMSADQEFTPGPDLRLIKTSEYWRMKEEAEAA